jgi:hypothetical protein
METPSTDNTPTGAKPAKGPSWLVTIPAFLIVLIFVLALPLSLLAFDTWRVVFNPTLVKVLITDEVVNSDLIPVALEWFSDRRAEERVQQGEALTGVDEPDIVLLMSFLDRDDWRGIRQEVLTDEFLTHLVSVTVDGVYAWIDSADRVPQIAWDLKPFVERVNSEHGRNAILIAYDNLPPCTQAEVDDFQSRLSQVPPGTEVLYNLCEFPDPWHEDQINDYVNALFAVVDNIPEQFALTDELARAADQGGVGPEALKQQLRTIRLAGMFAWALPLALLALIALLVVRSLRALSRWMGAPLVVGGLLALLPTLVYRWLITNVLAAGLLGETPDIIKVETVRVVTRVADAIFQPMLLQAVVVTLLGLTLVAWHWWGGRRPA